MLGEKLQVQYQYHHHKKDKIIKNLRDATVARLESSGTFMLCEELQVQDLLTAIG